ncbi:MAG: hypothetical protein HRT91_02765 [Piscirickettsiaceae bacterium]|nr:hypothetical protein [Piscirickettsiaceae bacterium]
MLDELLEQHPDPLPQTTEGNDLDAIVPVVPPVNNPSTHITAADLDELERIDYDICSDEEQLMNEDLGCWDALPPPPNNIDDFPQPAAYDMFERFHNL